MECFKCKKEMDREDGGQTIKGMVFEISLIPPDDTEANIKYIKSQYGKYSDAKGNVKIAICGECYLDGLFHSG